MSDERGPRITCRNNSTNKRQTQGCLILHYKHRSRRPFRRSPAVKPHSPPQRRGDLAAQRTRGWAGGRQEQSAWCPAPGCTQAAGSPRTRSGPGSSEGMAIVGIHRFPSKSSLAVSVTALEMPQLKLAPVLSSLTQARGSSAEHGNHACVLGCAGFFSGPFAFMGGRGFRRLSSLLRRKNRLTAMRLRPD